VKDGEVGRRQSEFVARSEEFRKVDEEVGDFEVFERS